MAGGANEASRMQAFLMPPIATPSVSLQKSSPFSVTIYSLRTYGGHSSAAPRCYVTTDIASTLVTLVQSRSTGGKLAGLLVPYTLPQSSYQLEVRKIIFI